MINNPIIHLDLIDIYQTTNLIPAECISFESVPGTFPKTDHNMGHKTKLNKHKNDSSYFEHHTRIQLEINKKKNLTNLQIFKTK